jgi:glutathione S-transferase
MRARMAIAVAGAQVRQIEVSLRAKPEAMLRASPKATVPVLVLADGTVLEQSLTIMRWALQQHDPENWLQNDALNAEWVTENDGTFKQYLDKYKYANRHPELSMEAHRNNAAIFLAKLQLQLNDQPYLQGDALTASDIAIMPFVRQCAQVDRNWFDAMAGNGLNTWLRRLEQSALFAQIMMKNEGAI